MLKEAKNRQFDSDCVLFDSWYGSVDNLKLIRRLGWYFLTRLKKNRKVNYAYAGNLAIEKLIIPDNGLEVHLKDHGMVRVFHRDDDGNGIQFWATDILSMDEHTRKLLPGNTFKIEEYHRNLKQYCGFEACQERVEISQIVNIQLAIRAFIRMEWIRSMKNISFFEQKMSTGKRAVYMKMKELNTELRVF